ncbi:MAG: hypothetical protein CM15mP103_12100 [Gammaproteobacteria bacterium]|nr:MAG: hypothetical protein CM15mP103_12100 [Gammaproteobacteria bacterium]
MVARRRRQPKIDGCLPALSRLVYSQPARRLRPRPGSADDRVSEPWHIDPAVFPGTDRDQMYLDVKLPEGASIDDSLALVTRVDEKLRAEP